MIAKELLELLNDMIKSNKIKGKLFADGSYGNVIFLDVYETK